MIVMKFGGTSLGSAERIKNAYKIVRSQLEKKPIVVVSAVGGITDRLIGTAKKARDGEETSDDVKEIIEKHYGILDEIGLEKEIIQKVVLKYTELMEKIAGQKILSKESLDVVQSFGERLSSIIFAAFLNKMDINAQRYAAYDAGFRTDNSFGSAEILPETYDLVNEALGSIDHVAVVTGFIGKTETGEITTLGRGGSDYTASIIGAAVKASEIQIWTDVDGVRRADPKVIPDAETIKTLSFSEASELAYFGAKVLHPKTILPAMKNNIPVRVLNTYNPDFEGTTIVNECAVPRNGIRAITFKKEVIVLNICSARMLNAYGFLEKIFSIFNYHNLVVDMLATTEVSVSITLDNIYPEKTINDIMDELNKIGNAGIRKEMAIVSVVGKNLGKNPKTYGRIFHVIGDSDINIDMISAGASETNISFIVDNGKAIDCVKALNEEFFNNG